MAQVSAFSSPFLLGFEEVERLLNRVSKSADGYPPYNIERFDPEDGQPVVIRITLAVAGFSSDDLEVSVEENQLTVNGHQNAVTGQEFLHRGIATRQFQRAFVLADGLEVLGADLRNGLLSIDLAQPEPQRVIKNIPISVRD